MPARLGVSTGSAACWGSLPATATWAGDPAFSVQVADTPQEMEHLLQAQVDAGYGARMAAGFCWPWSDPRQDGSLVPDVVIGDWSRPWNLRGDRVVGGAPPSALWATDPAGFGRVGCVYTAKGFEYDWNGVIIGPDLVWRAGRRAAVLRRQQGSRPPEPDQGDRSRIRKARPERLQSLADPRNDRDSHLLSRSRDPRNLSTSMRHRRTVLTEGRLLSFRVC